MYISGNGVLIDRYYTCQSRFSFDDMMGIFCIKTVKHNVDDKTEAMKTDPVGKKK